MEEQTHQGFIYRRSTPGEAWQLVGPAQAQTGRVGQIFADPYRAAAEGRKDAEESRKKQDQRFEAERLRLAQEAARLQQQAANRGPIPEGQEIGPDGRLRLIPSEPGAGLKTSNVAPDRDRIPQVRTMLDNIKRVRGMSDDFLAVGKQSGRVADWLLIGGVLGQNRANVEGALQMIQGDLIQQQIAKLSASNGGKGVASIANSETEAARMAASIANLSPDQSLEEFQTGINRAEQYYRRTLAGLEGADLADPAARKRYGIAEPGMEDQILGITPGNIAAAAAGVGKPRANPDGSVTVLEMDGTESVYTSQKNYDERMDRSGLNVYVSDESEEGYTPLEQRRDTFMGGVDAAVRGAADTATLGIADPLAALLNSTINGDSFAENWAQQRRINSADEKVNFWPRFGGQLAGAIPVGVGLARAGEAAMPSRPLLGTALAETGGGAAYGGTTTPDDPIMGALIGGGLALAGNQVGQRLLGPQIERAMSRGVDPVVKSLSRSVNPKIADKITSTLNDARRLNVPMALADADPKLRALAGSATRLAPAGREFAEEVIFPRGRGQAERAIGAIRRDFGPEANMIDARAGFKQQAQADSKPFYEAAFARAAPVDPEINAMLATPAGRQALNSAANIARNEGADPLAMGFDLDAAGEVIAVNAPSFETLHLVKRGLDSVVEGKRGINGQLNLDDPAIKAVDGLRARFRTRLGDLDTNYGAGNAAYASQMRNRDGLDFGYKAASPRINPDMLADASSRLPREPMQSGYRSGMVDQVEQMRFSGNPYEAVYGSPDQVAKVGALFPEGAQNFARQAELEALLARTQNETLGGSATAGRHAADPQFAPELGTQLVGESALGMATGVPPIGAITSAMRSGLGDRMRMGIGGSKKAEAVARLLLEPNPDRALSTVERLLLQQLVAQQSKTAGAAAGGALSLPFIGGTE